MVVYTLLHRYKHIAAISAAFSRCVAAGSARSVTLRTDIAAYCAVPHAHPSPARRSCQTRGLHAPTTRQGASSRRRTSTPRRGHVRGHRPRRSCSPPPRVATTSDNGAVSRASRREALSQHSASRAAWFAMWAALAESRAVGTTENGGQTLPRCGCVETAAPTLCSSRALTQRAGDDVHVGGGRVRTVVRLPRANMVRTAPMLPCYCFRPC